MSWSEENERERELRTTRSNPSWKAMQNQLSSEVTYRNHMRGCKISSIHWLYIEDISDDLVEE